jgi:hypothetical protein
MFRKVLIAGLMTIFIGTLLAYVYKEISYSTSMPKSPQPDAGRVKAISVNHGTIVYVTAREFRTARLIDHLFFYFAAWCGVAAGFLNYKYNVFRN